MRRKDLVAAGKSPRNTPKQPLDMQREAWLSSANQIEMFQ
jgi:hypothetical protein